jgi:hypothetical protein
MSEEVQKQNEELSPPRDYYIDLFESWKKSPLIKGQSKLYKSINFDNIIQNLKKYPQEDFIECSMVDDSFFYAILKCSNPKYDPYCNLIFNLLDVDFDYVKNGKTINLKSLFKKLYLEKKIETLGCNSVEIEQFVLEIENQKKNKKIRILKKELSALNSQNNNLILTFEKEIPEEYRGTFGDYFLGIKDFIKFCFGKNIFLTIELSERLIIKAFSKNSEDKFLVEVALDHFTNNLKYLFQQNKPELNIPIGIEVKDAEKALILLGSKISMLQMNLRLNSPLSIQTEYSDVKFLIECIIDFCKSQIRENHELITENLNLCTELTNLRSLLNEYKVKNILVDDKIDRLLSYFDFLKSALDKNDKTQVESVKREIKQFWILNKDHLIAIKVGATTVYHLIKIIFKI